MIVSQKEDIMTYYVLVFGLLSFFISFEKIQKLDDPKSKKLKTSFYKLVIFSFLGYPVFRSPKY
jgi:hypothetical protein